MEYQPVAIIFNDIKPANAISFKEGKWGCVLWMLASAVRGKTAAFDKHTYGCWGGGVGLGFGNAYKDFPGGEECFYYFLSTGNQFCEKGVIIAEKMISSGNRDFAEKFLHGESYKKSPELVKKFIKELPIIEVPKKYVIFKPLNEVDTSIESPEVVVFLVNPDQLAALIVMANYYREGSDNVRIPFAAGCQQIGIIPYEEGRSENPKAIVGLIDLSARNNIKKLLEKGHSILFHALETFSENGRRD
jgi:hypothetical protein